MTTAATPKSGKSTAKKSAASKRGVAKREDTTVVLPAGNQRRGRARVLIMKPADGTGPNPKAGAMLKTAGNQRRERARVLVMKPADGTGRNPKAGAALKTAAKKMHAPAGERTQFTVFSLLDLKGPHPDYLLLSNEIRKGFAVKVIENLKEAGIDKTFRERIIPARTLQHRITKGEPLSPAESERAYRVASIVSLADKVFGNHDKGLKWLHKPMKSLDGKSPLDVLDNDPGARIVEDLLGRLDEGYFA